MLAGAEDEEHQPRKAVTLKMIGTRIHITSSLVRGSSLGTAERDASQSPTEEAAERIYEHSKPGVPWVLRNGVSTRPCFKSFSKKP